MEHALGGGDGSMDGDGVISGTVPGPAGEDIRSSSAAAAAAATGAVERPNQFPWKLYDMLDEAEKRNEEHVISWIREGTAFKVHNREFFMDEYMKKMFNQTKYKSFQRQLNLWGFERFQQGSDKGAYYHPLFVKGRRDLCARLTRVRLKGEGKPTSKPSPAVASRKAAVASTTTTSRTSTNGGVIEGGGGIKRATGHLPIAPANISAVHSSSKISPGESTVSVATNSTTSSGVAIGAASSFDAEIPYRQAPEPAQQVADLLQYHATSRQERHRQIAAAAAALGNGTHPLELDSSPLLPVGSADPTTNRTTVDDRLSHGSAPGSIQHQDRALQHLNGGSLMMAASHPTLYGAAAAAVPPPLPPANGYAHEDPGSNQERRPSNQMLALLAATEQHREEELNLLLSLDQQEGDDASSSKRASV